ncbi:hypothetical protein H0H87_003584 [Tephrocybe sp. NHM501043]|nr:hypothetical protein H0H87_003584 [Tephrocybe sp. NHM501043]
MKSFASILFPLALATSAFAHGFVSKITIDGTAYNGNTPNGQENDSIIRLIDTTSPTKGATNPAVNCGPGAGKAALVGDAQPGSKLQFTWDSGNGGNWPHDTGPMITYMASCGTSSCADFDSTQAKWFKIDQQGIKADKSAWVQADVKNGAPASVTIPSTLAPGNYMIRHEIIALHLGESMGGAEFYPSCAQLKVGGSQTGAPTASELVSLPGAYSDNDPGIFDKNAYNRQVSYPFPGPNIAAFVGGSASGDDSNNTPSSTTTGKATASTTSATPATSTKSTGTCKLKKKVNSSSAAAAAATVRPRHLSRVMRGLIAGHAPS